MKLTTTNSQGTLMKTLCVAAVALAALLATAAEAAVPGITGTSFSLVASADYISQPDGAQIYSWGYGCDSSTTPTFVPFAGTCGPMQMPGPTLIVTENQLVTVTLTNKLPLAAGNTSIIFSGLTVSAGNDGVAGLRAQEAAPNSSVTYTFTAGHPGTYAYYSGTQSDLQIEMGLYGAVVVLPATSPASCKPKGPYSSSAAAYGNANTCYDREYLFQFAELTSSIHDAVLAQVNACSAAPCPQIAVRTEPVQPNYFLINGRSMPDDMDAAYAPAYPRQPYNGNPHMHPGENVLMRVVGQGRVQHPFHFHGNHARVLARDGNLIVSASDSGALAGPLLFTIPTVSGQSVDAIFTWTGKGLNWDVYNHKSGDGSSCTPDANGYNSLIGSANYGEWCADHLKAIPITPPDPQIVLAGPWYSGTPYLGIQTPGSSGFTKTPEAPGTLNLNPEAGYAYMWHSHDEREITTNDVFPGGMMMMLLIDPPVWSIDETL